MGYLRVHAGRVHVCDHSTAVRQPLSLKAQAQEADHTPSPAPSCGPRGSGADDALLFTHMSAIVEVFRLNLEYVVGIKREGNLHGEEGTSGVTQGRGRGHEGDWEQESGEGDLDFRGAPRPHRHPSQIKLSQRAVGRGPQGFTLEDEYADGVLVVMGGREHLLGSAAPSGHSPGSSRWLREAKLPPPHLRGAMGQPHVTWDENHVLVAEHGNSQGPAPLGELEPLQAARQRLSRQTPGEEPLVLVSPLPSLATSSPITQTGDATLTWESRDPQGVPPSRCPSAVSVRTASPPPPHRTLAPRRGQLRPPQRGRRGNSGLPYVDFHATARASAPATDPLPSPARQPIGRHSRPWDL